MDSVPCLLLMVQHPCCNVGAVMLLVQLSLSLWHPHSLRWLMISHMVSVTLFQSPEAHASTGLSPTRRHPPQSALQDDVHAAVQDALHGMQAPQPATSGDDTSVGHSSNSGRLYPLPVAGPIAADADAFLAELEQQIVAEMLEELEQLEAFEAAEIAAAVADREALVAAGERVREA